MTFIVNYSGAIFQQNLDRHTSELAAQITSFNPDRSWKKIDATNVAK